MILKPRNSNFFPKRIVWNLIQKGFVVEVSKGVYQAKTVYKEEQKAKNDPNYIPIMDTHKKKYTARCPKGHIRTFVRGDKGRGKPILCDSTQKNAGCNQAYPWNEWTFEKEESRHA